MRKRTSLWWLLVFPALGVLMYLMLRPAPPEPTPAEDQAVWLIMLGRIPGPVPAIEMQESSVTVIVYIRDGFTAEEQMAALADMDSLIEPLIEPLDVWVYYFDTINLNDQLNIWYGMRCPVESIGRDLPWDDRGCEYSAFTNSVPLTLFLQRTGFEEY